MRSLDDVETLIAFFEARFGQLYAFRWKDWSDFRSCKPSLNITAFDQELAIGDGTQTQFQLVKTYRSGSYSYSRPIAKPVAGTVRIAVEQDEMQETIDYGVDLSTGMVTFMRAPDPAMQITAGFEFDVPVRFDTDSIQTSVASFQAGEIPTVPIMEVRV